jgi:phosphoribosylformylglycinamidine synthase
LTDNDRPVYQDRWVHLRVEAEHCVFLQKGEVLTMPMAHAEGKLVPRDEPLRRELWSADRVALRYVGADGEDCSEWPFNPNGSIDDIAGLTDATGRILGLMPHPERHFFPWQHPTWTRDGLAESPDGSRLFAAGVRAVS